MVLASCPIGTLVAGKARRFSVPANTKNTNHIMMNEKLNLRLLYELLAVEVDFSNFIWWRKAIRKGS
jgi:hypothetical protein